MATASAHVLLVGFMGSGKTTVGLGLAERLGRPFVDLDSEVERRDGRSVPEIFAESGEAAFRAAETAALSALADAEPSVVACGGGVVLDAGNREVLRRLGTVVYLEVTAAEALSRTGALPDRPLLAGMGVQEAGQLLSSRAALYEAVADVRVSTSGRSPEDVAAAVAEALAGEAA